MYLLFNPFTAEQKMKQVQVMVSMREHLSGIRTRGATCKYSGNFTRPQARTVCQNFPCSHPITRRVSQIIKISHTFLFLENVQSIENQASASGLMALYFHSALFCFDSTSQNCPSFKKGSLKISCSLLPLTIEKDQPERTSEIQLTVTFVNLF